MMFNRWYLADIGDSLRTQRGRIGLSVMAITIGMAALSLLVCILGGLRSQANRMVQELGGNVCVVLSPDSATTGGLEKRDLAMIRGGMPDAWVSGLTRYRVPSPYGDGEIELLAADPLMARVRAWHPVAGRLLDAADEMSRRSNCLISRAFAAEYNIQVGHVVPLRGALLSVVGIVAPTATGDADLLSDSPLGYGPRFLVVPASLQPYWATDASAAVDRMDSIFIKGREGLSANSAVGRARGMLEQRTPHLEGLSYVTPDVLVAKIRRLERTLQLTSGSVAFLCLILGGTTLMSLMIANVKERVAEIGLRMSLGASELEIAAMFMGEGVVMTVCGALLGSGLACGVLLVSGPHLTFPYELGAPVILVPLLVALVLGAVFSSIPARSAASITPSDALRAE